MKKKYVTYVQYGKTKKAVLDESLYLKLTKDPSIEQLVEYENEMLMERRFGESFGKSDNRKTLLG